GGPRRRRAAPAAGGPDAVPRGPERAPPGRRARAGEGQLWRKPDRCGGSGLDRRARVRTAARGRAGLLGRRDGVRVAVAGRGVDRVAPRRHRAAAVGRDHTRHPPAARGHVRDQHGRQHPAAGAARRQDVDQRLRDLLRIAGRRSRVRARRPGDRADHPRHDDAAARLSAASGPGRRPARGGRGAGRQPRPAASRGAMSTALIVGTIALLYVWGVTGTLALQNRSPQSTFAWVLLFVLCPPVALIVYTMFGRGQYAFSRHQTMARLLEQSTLADRAAALVAAQPGAIAALAATQGESARLAAMLGAAGRSPLTTGNDLEILQNASEKYPRLLDDLRAATQSVHLVYYEWASDAFTEEVGGILREKVREGVEVRILYDPVGSYFMLDRRYVEGLRGAGIRMQPFSSLYRVHTISYRSHRKLAIVDGRIGYSGGLNMTEKHLTGPKGFTGWRDTHARIAGPAATILQSIFATMWLNATGENLFDERHFPHVAAAVDGVSVQVVSAGPDSRWETIRQAYLAMIALAR